MGRNSMRSHENKDRSIQEYLETLSKYSIVVESEARSRERLAISSNSVTCSRSLQHTTSSLHRKSGMCENSLPKGSLESKIATGRAKIELAMRSTRSTKPRRKIILGTIERFEKLRENLYQHRASQNIWSTSFCGRKAEQGQDVGRGHKTRFDGCWSTSRHPPS